MPPLPSANVLGVQVVSARFADVRSAIRGVLAATERKAECVCPTGAHGLVEAQRDPALRDFLNSARFVVPDGMPVALAARAMGFTGTERVYGPDIMWAVLTDSQELGTRHFFYGGKEGVADRLARQVVDRLPGLRIAGTHCPPFRPLTPVEEDRLASRINESMADVVWVGLSTPKQERWIARMRDRLDVKLVCSVGAAFDYHTGSIRPAPRWMQVGALEWLYRLLQEPRRLWRRYLRIVPGFLMLISLQLLGLRRFRPTRTLVAVRHEPADEAGARE